MKERTKNGMALIFYGLGLELDYIVLIESKY